MSNARIHRQKVQSALLAIMMLFAVGAEITKPAQSMDLTFSEVFTRLTTTSSVAASPASMPVSLPAASPASSAGIGPWILKVSIADQLTRIDATEVATSRFYAPKHAPVNWGK